MAETAAEATRDAFFGGRLVLRQPASGHRSGTDAVLLAASVPRDFSGRVFDVGAGVGVVGLGIASRCPQATVTLVENDPHCLALAAENVEANEMAGLAIVTACDVLSSEQRRGIVGRADLVVTNPPFHNAAQVRGAPDAGRRSAHVLPANHDLGDWLTACLEILDAKGVLIVLHNAAAVPELVAHLARRAGDLTLLPIQPRAGAPAGRVLLRARKGSRAPFRFAAPLVLHQGAGFTQEAGRLHDGVTSLSW